MIKTKLVWKSMIPQVSTMSTKKTSNYSSSISKLQWLCNHLLKKKQINLPYKVCNPSSQHLNSLANNPKFKPKTKSKIKLKTKDKARVN